MDDLKWSEIEKAMNLAKEADAFLRDGVRILFEEREAYRRVAERQEDELGKAREEIERLRELTRPIPVGERLPDDGLHLALHPGHGQWTISFFEDGQVIFCDNQPTHWRPLPAGPEAIS